MYVCYKTSGLAEEPVSTQRLENNFALAGNLTSLLKFHYRSLH